MSRTSRSNANQAISAAPGTATATLKNFLDAKATATPAIGIGLSLAIAPAGTNLVDNACSLGTNR